MNPIAKFSGDNLRKAALAAAPFGPGFTAEQLVGAETLEVWGSAFTAAGADYCEFRLLDKAGNRLATRRVGGY